MQGMTSIIGSLLTLFSTGPLLSWPQVSLETLNQKNISELQVLHKISHTQSKEENRREQLQTNIYYLEIKQ